MKFQKMKKLILLITIVLISNGIFAQEAPKNREDSLRIGWWKRSTQIGLNFSGAAFNASWQGGGVNNLTLGTYFNNLAVFTKGKGVWTNDIQLQYGRLSNFYKNDSKEIRKGVDRIFLDTKYTRVVHKALNWYSSLNFLSQFDKGFDYSDVNKPSLISKSLHPGFLTLASGFEWKPKPYLITQAGLGGRTTFISDDKNITKLYGVSKGKTSLTELGLQGVIAFDKDIAKNINLKLRDQMFLAIAPKSKALDHNINIIATAKINKYLNVNLAAILIRDFDQVSKADIDAKKYKSVWQATGGFNLGFSLKL